MDIFARDAIAMAKMREGVPLTAHIHTMTAMTAMTAVMANTYARCFGLRLLFARDASAMPKMREVLC